MASDRPTAKEVEAYQTDGFVSLHGFFAPDAYRRLTANLQHFIQHTVPQLPREHVFCEEMGDLTTLKQIQHLEQHDELFHSLIHEGPIRDVATALLDQEVIPKNIQYFNKAPKRNQPTPPHQDGYYFRLEPCHAVTLWLALDPVDEANGCVRYVKGSQRHGLRPHHRTGTLGFSQGIADFPTPHDHAEVAQPAEPGDLLAHHALTIHRAEGNLTADRHRRALGFIYYGCHAREDTAANAAYQAQLASELRSVGKI